MRLPLLVAACALVAATAAPAVAHDDASIWADCGYQTVAQDTVTGPGHYTGFGYGVAVVTSRSHGSPVAARLTCYVLVNGVRSAEVTGTGAGVVVAAGPLAFVADDTADIRLCQSVDVLSDDSPSETQCAWTTYYQLPPQYVLDVLTYLFDPLNWALAAFADPVVCAANGGQDVYVGDEWVWDCPPYEGGYVPPGPPGLPPTMPPTGPDLALPTQPGGGWNDGRTGFLAVSAPAPPDTSAAAVCAFRADDTGIAVHGVAAPGGTVRCVLRDEDGATLYDDSASGSLAGTAAPYGGLVTVCTEGPGTGLHCRYGVAA